MPPGYILAAPRIIEEIQLNVSRLMSSFLRTTRIRTYQRSSGVNSPGILQWAIRGCLAWQREGLMVPDEVQTATKEYKASMDDLGQFIEDCCLTGSPEYRIRASELYEAYKRWCGQSDQQIASQKALGQSPHRALL